MSESWRTRVRLAGDPGLLAVGAILLMCAPVLNGSARLVIIPALLLAPGYAFLRLLGRDVEWRAISMAAPVSVAIIICVAMALNAGSVRLDRVSLGPVLGAVTALCLSASYARQLIVARRRYSQRRFSKRAAVRGNVAADERDATPSR